MFRCMKRICSVATAVNGKAPAYVRITTTVQAHNQSAGPVETVKIISKISPNSELYNLRS
jgi:hypothetical protein